MSISLLINKPFSFLAYSFLLFVSSSAFAQVTSNFTAKPIAGCAPLIVNFTDQSTGSVTGWTWNFGDGSSPSNLQNPGHVYALTGVYTVTLTVTDGVNSDTKIKVNYINVYKPPVANFSLTPDTACVGETVTFTDGSTISAGGAPIKNYAWDFGDGNNATVTTSTTTHSYNTPGTYPVSLIVTDSNGCQGVINKPNAIVIVPTPKASFTATPKSACVPPLNVTFTNTSTFTGTTSFFWNFGDGNTSTLANPTNNYTSSGTFTVTLIVNQNGCIDSVVMPNYIVIQQIAASFSATPTSVCTGQQVTFTNTSVPVPSSASWNFGDATTSTQISPTHIYSTAGNYNVTMTATDASGCTNSTTVAVTVNQTPTANFIADTMNACSVPFTVTFTNQSTGGTNYIWDFGDAGTSTLTNPVHTYTASGTYTVTLIAINAAGGCSDTIVKNTFINISPPQANFTHLPDSGCAPLTVNFLSTSTSIVDPIVTYQWNFGDGNTATLGVPAASNTYTAVGIYSPTLIVQTANGCTDTFTCVNCIKVGTTPVANFGVVQDTVCYGLPMMFNDSSTGATGWMWHFGDNQTSTMQNPQHVYGDTGTYAVYLVVYNNGCADTSAIDSVTVLPPKAVFTYSLSCTNYYTVVFHDTSEGADSLFWNFGDGGMDSSNNKNPIHVYPSRGPFTVSLTAYNFSSGCSNTATASFTIAEPIASFSVTNTYGCYPFTANFISTSQDANSVFWNFGDPTTIADTSMQDTTMYTYANTGQYNVSLVITDVNGCKDTANMNVGALGPYPYFAADTLTGCRPLIVTFSDTSLSDSALVQWTWDFGDGTPLLVTTTGTVVHTYTITGLFNVTMTVKDTNGCVKTISKSSYVEVTFPMPSFTYNHFSCKGNQISFTAGGFIAGDTCIWNFGDGTIDTIAGSNTDTHTYASDNTYTVSLTMIDKNGCDSTIKDTLLILQPTALFGDSILNIGCKTLQVQFLDSSLGYVNQWYWDFGNGANSNLQDPSYTYTQPGYYVVTLVVTNPGGCKDTVQMDSVYVPGPIGTFSFSPSGGCNPLTVCFTANSVNSDQYIWDFGDGAVVTTVADTVCHTYLTPGSFTPVMVMQNTLPNGNPCLDQAPNLTGNVNVTNVINTSLNVPNTIHVPIDSIVSVTASYSGGVPPYTFMWTPDTGLSCTNCTSVLVVGTGDSILYTFTIYDTAGCVGTTTLLVLSEPCLQAKLIPNVFSPNDDGYNDMFYIPGVCSYEDYELAIYDRWGTLMFSTTQRNNGWDGRNNSGVPAKEGVYYFVVHLKGERDANGTTKDDQVFKGFVTLVR